VAWSAVFTDAVSAAAEPVVATVGSIEDLEQLVVVESLMPPAVGAGAAEDATGIPIKADPGASDESVGFDPQLSRSWRCAPRNAKHCAAKRPKLPGLHWVSDIIRSYVGSVKL